MTAPPIPKPGLSSSKHRLAIHSLIESSQSQHGLRHGDYAQYRSYCTRRLSRLRHAKPVRLELSKLATTEKGSNKAGRHAFKPILHYREPSLANKVADKHINFMLVELMSTERAWSYAMELKADYDDIKSGAAKSKKEGSRSHFMKRFRKAVTFSNRLEQMALAAADDKTIVEAKAYATWMRGNLSLEKADHKTACVEYGAALNICRTLGQPSDVDTDVPSLEMRDYFTARAENVIEPLLRFCQYELREGGMSEYDILNLMKDLSIDGLDNEKGISATSTSTPSATTSSIEFRNQTVPISNNALRVALLKLDTLVSTNKKNTSKKSKKQELHFVNLLSGYDDAISIVSKEYKEMEGMKSGPAVDAKKRELESISGYLKFQKQKLFMERNELMVNELRSSKEENSKLDEITHLYDALLQDARTVASLPGGPVAEEEAAPTEDDFLLEANAHILRFRALRCYYLGRLYSNKLKYKEAITLFDHALTLASEAAEELNACATDDDSRNMAMVESMVQLEKEITGAKCRVVAYAYLVRIGRMTSSSSSNSRSLLTRLDDFDGGDVQGGAAKYHLANVPLALQYMPCKPTFFDIAGNHVGELPEDQLKKAIEEYPSGGRSSGLLGWFRRG